MLCQVRASLGLARAKDKIGFIMQQNKIVLQKTNVCRYDYSFFCLA